MKDTRSWELRLGYLIHDVSRLRRVRFDRELAPLRITRSQWWVLAFISRNNGLPQTQLANDLEIGKVALGSLIDRLQGSGYVTREPDTKDRRVKRIFLTDKARKLLKGIKPVSEAFNERIREGITDAELECAAITLFKMKENLVRLSNGEAEPEEEDGGLAETGT